MLLLADKEDEAPLHIVGGVAVGVMTGLGLTVMVIEADVAHAPAEGVKVYTVVPGALVIIGAGFQVPEMAGTLVELIGKVGGVEFWHKGPIAAKVGVT